MNQKIGTKKLQLGIALAAVVIGTPVLAYFIKLKPSTEMKYVTGLVEKQPAGLWIRGADISKLKSEMLVVKKKVLKDSFALKLVDPSLEKALFDDSSVLSFKTMTNIVVQ